MWTKLETPDGECTWSSGATFKPLATFADGKGGRLQLGEDDHCLVMGVLRLDLIGRFYYKPSAWIPPEVARVMGTLVP